MKHRIWSSISDSFQLELTTEQLDQLGTFSQWLRTEAGSAGGLGPSEANRVDGRHIGDSLLFATVFPGQPSALTDLGSGVGLPGIPLAIIWPSTEVTLIDRSGRRCDLARRAVRVLGLENIHVLQEDIFAVEGRRSAMVSRAATPVEQLAGLVRSLLAPEGIAVVGGSWTTRPDAPGWEIREIRVEVLDRTVWLLIMRHE